MRLNFGLDLLDLFWTEVSLQWAESKAREGSSQDPSVGSSTSSVFLLGFFCKVWFLEAIPCLKTFDELCLTRGRAGKEGAVSLVELKHHQ